MAILTLVYVSATIWLVHLSRQQIKLAADLEKSRIRPFVIFDFIFERFMMCLQIKNIGQTPACNIKIDVSPAVRMVFGKGSQSANDDHTNINFLKTGISFIAPSRAITTIIGRWDDLKGNYPTMKFVGTISYTDLNGEKYPENIDIDLSLYEGLMYSDKKDINDIVKQIEEVAKKLDHIATGFTKPVVRIMTEAQYRKERNKQSWQFKRAWDKQNKEEKKPDNEESSE